ncbi:hypothetical protein F4824DRAFT_444745 [Ustulina deusta]|nr:hypothetical protein F4824DRAFT_444745 [Ustulina deusta]
MSIMTLHTPEKQTSMPIFSSSFASNLRHVDFCANASTQHPTIQNETLSKARTVTTNWNFATSPKNYRHSRSLSWSGTNAVSNTASLPLAKLAPWLSEVPSFTHPFNSSISSSSLRSNESPDSENLDGEADTNEVGNPSLLNALASNNPDPIGKNDCSKLMTCGLPAKNTRLSPESHPIEIPGPSICATPSAQQGLPIRTKIGSSDSKKYELRRFGDKAGLYYSSTIWPEELPHRRPGFLFGQLRTDLNNHIEKACKEKKTKRVMKKHRITLTGQAFTIELRLSGCLGANGEDIELLPTIWVICASEFYKTLVEEALSQCQLSWVVDEPIEVVKGLTFNKRRERVGNLDLSGGFCFADSYRLHLHIEEAGEDNSACGLVTCATITKDGRIIDQCISRLGGLLLLNNEVVCGSSTAHGIIDMLMSAGLDSSGEECVNSLRDISNSDTDSEAESYSSVETDSEADGESTISVCDLDHNGLELSSTAITSNITHWNSIPDVIIFDFIRTALPDLNQNWSLRNDVRAHHFALFEFGRDPFQKLNNSYEYKSARHLVTTDMHDLDIPQRLKEMTILLGHNTFACRRLLPGISKIYMAGVEFSTRRIFLDDPLAPGTSGSWVVSDSCLHGIIIASYGQEPIAHMIPTQQLYCDIKSALPPILSVRLPPVRDGIKERRSELARLHWMHWDPEEQHVSAEPMELGLPVSDGNLPEPVATSSLCTIIIWGLPLNISETELDALLDSQWDWVHATLIPPKQCQDSTSRFAVVTFRNFTGAEQANDKLDGKHISCSGDALIVEIINNNQILGYGAFEGLAVSDGEYSAAPSVSWLVEPPTEF